MSLCIGLTISLHAVEVKKKEVNNYITFQKGKFDGTSLDGKGGLFIGPEIKKINGPDREFYLSIDIARNGTVYVGTGHKASVFKIDPAGAPTEVFRTDGLDIYALLVANNGVVYAATSPDGKLYKTVKDKPKSPEMVFDPEEKFIWDIKQDNAGNIIVAVGNAGGIYRVNNTGNAVKIFTSEDTHIISLYITKTGSILAGSGDRGILYKIDNTKVKVLFDSPFEEIRGISEDKEGNIYFSATRGIKQQNVLNNAQVETFLKKKKKDEEAIPPPEKSILYCRRTDGVVERVWSSYTEYIYDVCYDQKSNGVLIGTGNSGRVYRVDKEGNFSIVYESEAAQVFKIAATSGGFTLITNNTAVITGIENTLMNKGTYLSEVFDLGIQSKLGKIYWDAEISTNTNVSLFVRTGNSNVPDSTWSKWSAPFTDSENSGINISDIRYFQVKAVLNATTPSASPRLNNFKVYYIQSNLKPRLRKVEIKKQEKQKAPILVNSKTSAPPPAGKNHLTLQWRASDPNKDKLKYNLFLKRIGDRDWVLFKEDITVPRESLDTRLFEDGKYLLKVAADDALANPPAAAKTAELISSPFLIDSTAPEISGFSKQGSRVVFSVIDKTSLVARVLYSYNGKMWFPVFPVDNIADSKSENYDFTLTGKKANKYIFIKVVDEFDNSKVFQKAL
jgi:sugar lactone lactonase YvrE